VNKIRVLLANHPMMIPDAIRQLVEKQEDMEVVGDCRGPMKILQETGRVNADAVILAQEGLEEAGLCSQLLAVYPDLTIVGLIEETRSAFALRLCSRRRDLENGAGETIVDAIRSSVSKHGWR
jgi:DNA-binding NarL/FixJ family response regulator